VRILHTSDWHVGKQLRGRSRADEHRSVLAEIAAVVRDEAADIVLVGGDLFDSASPSPEAEEIVYAALVALAATGAQVVAIAGNHDGPRRLDAVAPLLELAGVRVVSTLRRPDEGGVLMVDTRGGERARIALVPFPSKRQVVHADELMGTRPDEQRQQYADRVARVTSALCSGLDGSTVNVALAHLTVVGGLFGGGERLAQSVLDYAVPASIFPDTLQYAALGHLHRSQRVDSACPVWFSGSPLQLDFGETEDAKSVLVVDVAPGTPAKVRSVPLSSGRRLRTLTGTLPELTASEGTTGDDYLRVVVREPRRAGLADEVRELFPEAVDVMLLPPDDDAAPPTRPERSGRTPQDLFASYLEDQSVSDPRLEALFAELMEEAHAPDPA